MRRYGERIVKSAKYRHRPGAYAIIVKNEKVLLSSLDKPDPVWDLPGGGIDPGESPVQALHREVMEETGRRIYVDARLGVYQRFVWTAEYGEWFHKICHVFLASPTLTYGPPTEAGHITQWFDPIDAVRLLNSKGDSAFLERVMTGDFR